MKIFISFDHRDDSKCKAFTKALQRADTGFTPIVVANRREPGRPLADKVIDGIKEADYVVPILTQSSISNQWVNQEIGYARAIDKQTIPLVEKTAIEKLKGFIHAQNDLPFSFVGNRQNSRRESAAFRSAYRELIAFLQNQRSRILQSTISPQRVRSGDLYTTTVLFKGTVLNGFFDNIVVHLDSSFRCWNWDPETLRKRSGMRRSRVPGELNGAVDVTRSYTHDTTKWPRGKYRIYVRLYSHLKEGEKARQVVAENEHNLEVY